MKNHIELSGTQHPFIVTQHHHKETFKKNDVIKFKLVLKKNHHKPLSFPSSASTDEKKQAFAKKYGLSEERKIAVQEFADFYGIKIIQFNDYLGIINMEGKIKNVEKAFKIKLEVYSFGKWNDLRKHKSVIHLGPIFIPKKIHSFVEAVIGLRKIPFKHETPSKKSKDLKCASAAIGYSSDWFAKHYDFPKQLNGDGQKIAIISYGGGFSQKELNKHYRQLGISIKHEVEVNSLHGVNNQQGVWGYDYELNTDIQVAQCAAPHAQISVFFTSNGLDGLADAIESICEQEDRATIISYSWSGSESDYAKKDIKAMERILESAAIVFDISILVCTGDKGSTNEESNKPKTQLTPTYPATSNYVTACGGTMFSPEHKKRTEKVWQSTFLYDIKISNASGGGFSNYMTRPNYQKEAIEEMSKNKLPNKYKTKRGIPDIAAYADVAPNGIAYWIHFDGKDWLTGGTSASTPLLAALIARINQGLKKNIGFLNPWLYQMNSKGLKPIPIGNNQMPNGPESWKAEDGWDPCTGLGVPNGKKMFKWFERNFDQAL